MPSDPNEFDLDARKTELAEHFEKAGPEGARREIALLPYYHQLENEITKPNQGTFVTRYFQTKWRPSLGAEASNIVLALRLLANKDGETFASQELIASYAGMSVRQLKRWLSDNERAVKDRSSSWRAQWQLLHEYFLRSKSSRYLLKTDPTQGAIVRRTTSLYHVAMDDPVHPDDEPSLVAAAAVRIANEEHAKLLQDNDRGHKGPAGPNGRKSITLTVDNSGHKGPAGPYPVGPTGPSRSVSDRPNASNVKRSPTKKPLKADPRVQELTEAERARREELAVMIGQKLKLLAGDRSNDPHKSLGFHRRVAFLMDEGDIMQALGAVHDAARPAGDNATSTNDPDRYFGAVIRSMAQQQGVDLGVRWSQEAPEAPERRDHPVRRG